MEYEFVQLGSVCTFENGDRGKNYPNEKDFTETGIPFVNGGHIINGKIDISQLNYISEQKYSQLRAGKASRGDILFSLRGSLGKCVRNPFEKAAIASALVIVRPNEKIDRDYLFYVMNPSFFVKQGENNDNGSVQINLSVDILKSFSIPLPSMEKQKRIAFFLDSIDKKIDNNNVISAELEGMAKDLYDYWFVQFDFPDENGKPYKSSGGKMVWNDELKREIPEGWENGIVSDLGTVVTGGTPSTGCAEYFAKSKSGHAWATPKDLSNLNGRYFYHGEADITDAGLKNSAGNIMPKGSVLFTTRAPIGYIAITANEACTNQGFKSIIPAKKFGTEFVFQTLKMLTPQMQRVGVGSTFKEVSKDVFSRQSIVIPSVNLLKKYAALTLDIAEKIRNTQEENVELTSLRDFLLPMLMNGQVKVKGA